MVNKRLGDVVKQERLKLNLSQNALAEQAKVSLRTVSDIETYNGNPRLDTLYVQIAIQNGHLCHVRRSVCDIIGGQPKTN